MSEQIDIAVDLGVDLAVGHHDMEFRSYSSSDQLDIAVDLGVVQAPLLGVLNLRQLMKVAPTPPPQVIDESALKQLWADHGMEVVGPPLKIQFE